MMALYLLGFTAAILSSVLLHKVLKINTKSLFVIEMPNYKIPSIKNIFYEVVEKTKAFIDFWPRPKFTFYDVVTHALRLFQSFE